MFFICEDIRKGNIFGDVSTTFLRELALLLGLAVSKSSSKTLRIVSLILHPRSLCVSADFDGKINLRMSKSVFSGFCGVAEFLQKKEHCGCALSEADSDGDSVLSSRARSR